MDAKKVLKYEGVVQAVSVKEKSRSYKINDDWYSAANFKNIPSAEKGEMVKGEYEMAGRDGSLKSINTLTKAGEVKGEVVFSSQATKEKVEGTAPTSTSQAPKTAKTIEDVVAEGAKIWAMCYIAIGNELSPKRNPATDGELASVNSLYIRTGKKMGYDF
jgi:hypothetical protein